MPQSDSRKLAHAIEKRLHLIADPSIRKDMAALCEHLIAALDERNELLKWKDAATAGDLKLIELMNLRARLQAENEAFVRALSKLKDGDNCTCMTDPHDANDEFCMINIAAAVLKEENHGEQ